MRVLGLAVLIWVSAFFMGCGEDGEESVSATVTRGAHFQGRDCLACHNADLQQERHLLVGGTLFKDSNISSVDDLSQSCGGDFLVNFLDASYGIQISSKDFEDLNSKGYKGKGNIFVLSRMLDTLNGDYYIRITDRVTGVTIAQSATLHSFAAGEYDLNNSADLSNRNACNACHQKVGQSGAAGYLYANVRLDLCQ